MKTNESKENIQNNDIKENVCNLTYLTEMMSGKKTLIKAIMDVFLKQIPEELQSINDAITKKDYKTIKNFAHTMKSSVSIMSVSLLAPILKEMEELADEVSTSEVNRDEKIIQLNQQLNLICRQAMEEIEKGKLNYV